MKRFIALDSEEQGALLDLANAAGQYVPSYIQNFSDHRDGVFRYLYDAEEVERIWLLGTRAGLVSP